ncbi:MAG TPA: serine--tRNA ligase [Candidatus Eisenbacteria bacterium]|uniref:Serine--tRNA ligase n=1 Tax=Eiseniibacteriota bacterium TaxID=2212470 RepID=A0A7V2ATP8_UNCEI|nr:serine--tRNA ligase [Candidatus Eisenbacteria bacterium]
MLDRKLIRKDPDAVREGIKRKGVDFDLDSFLGMDERLRSLIVEVERLKHERNDASQKISESKKRGEECKNLITGMKNTSNRIKEIDGEIKELKERIDALALGIPNLPHETVPFGTCPDHNVETRRWGEIAEPPFKPLPHWEIGEKLGILDMPAGARLSGRGFVVLRGDGALLSRALASFMLDLHIGQGYEELSVPYMVTRDCMVGTGQLPKLEEDMYLCEKDDLFMIPTAEVPVTNIHRESILEGDELPIRYAALTPCFRREAGSYGQDTRGLIRVHQFDKVEMVKFVEPETSYDELESLLADATAVLEELEIPYRVIELCSMDLSFSAAKCYDIETYAPGLERWLEVSSCSNFEDFQARRANIRYRKGEGKPEFVHTLNGSGLALPRVLATILELNQTPTGKVRIPKVLSPYMKGKEYLEPAR